jgi:hypothetical protein
MGRLQGNTFGDCLSTEGKDLLHQGGGPGTGGQYFVEIPDSRRILRHLVPGHFGITENGAEDIVEIMGNAAGQGADGLHLLGLLQLGLELFAFSSSRLRSVMSVNMQKEPANWPSSSRTAVAETWVQMKCALPVTQPALVLAIFALFSFPDLLQNGQDHRVR